MENNRKYAGLLWAALFGMLLMSSCNDENKCNDSLSEEIVTLNVSLMGITEKNESSEITKSGTEVPATRTVTVPTGNNMVLEATLAPAPATRGTNALATGVKYRVIAFKQGNISAAGYVSHADYAVGTTGTIAGYLHVPAGTTYTFVCYSQNSTDNLPAFNNAVLDVTANPATQSLLHAQFDQAITSSAKTLSFSFTPQFSQVTVIADATAMEKDITNINAALLPNYSASLNLSTAALTAETAAERTIPWGTITAGQTLTSVPCAVFTNGDSSICINIPSVTIGGITRTNLTATFGSNSMQAGHKYLLRLKFRKEGVVTGSLMWAMGNLIKSGNTYSFATTQEYYSNQWDGGDYWNWCTLDPTNYTNTYYGSYNSSLDPCGQVAPTGTWRMPTLAELNNLIGSGSVVTEKNGVKGRYFGITTDPVTGTEDDYVFLPAAGYRYSNTTEMFGYLQGFYWSSTPNGNSNTHRLTYHSSDLNTNSTPREYGFTIRCVK